MDRSERALYIAASDHLHETGMAHEAVQVCVDMALGTRVTAERRDLFLKELEKALSGYKTNPETNI